MEEHHLTVPRTARYHTLGDPVHAREVWIVLHGYGQLARFFLRAFEGLEDGLLLVAPEGLSRFYWGEDHSRVGATWMTREDREQEIADQITYLDALSDATAGGRPLHALGFSQGVATAVRWALSGRTRVQRLVLWGGSLPAEPDLWKNASRSRSSPVELIQGEQDDVVPPEVQTQNATRLRGAGVDHILHMFPGGHALDALTLRRILVP